MCYCKKTCRTLWPPDFEWEKRLDLSLYVCPSYLLILTFGIEKTVGQFGGERRDNMSAAARGQWKCRNRVFEGLDRFVNCQLCAARQRTAARTEASASNKCIIGRNSNEPANKDVGKEVEEQRGCGRLLHVALLIALACFQDMHVSVSSLLCCSPNKAAVIMRSPNHLPASMV